MQAIVILEMRITQLVCELTYMVAAHVQLDHSPACVAPLPAALLRQCEELLRPFVLWKTSPVRWALAGMSSQSKTFGTLGGISSD